MPMGAQSGVLSDPRLLAAAAGGLLAATLALWAFRGLPLGLAGFWLTPLPLFAAGFATGPGSAAGAVGIAALLVWIAAGGLPVLIFLAAFGVPVTLLVATGLRGAQFALNMPLALLGLWPALLLLIAAWLLSGEEGGLAGALREASQHGLRRMGVAPEPAITGQMSQLMAPATAFWMALALFANAIGAQGALAKRRLALAATPRWSTARLPGWYPVLPAITLIAWALAPAGDIVALSLLMVLLLPVFLQGIAAVHSRSVGKPGRAGLLAGFYFCLIILSLPAAAAVTAFGFYEQFVRRGAPPGGKT